MAERRAEGVRLLEGGEMSQAQIARYLGVSEAAVSQWKRKLEELFGFGLLVALIAGVVWLIQRGVKKRVVR